MLNVPPISVSFALAFAFGAILTPQWARLARRRGIVDRPAHRKTHKQAIPYLGGVAVFSSLLLALGLTWVITPIKDALPTHSLVKGAFILVASLGVTAIGLWDDCCNISAKTKLLGQVFFATLFAVFGFQFPMLHIPGLPALPLPGVFSVVLTVFWIVAIINAFNMVDGLDGLAGSVATLSLFMTALASALLGNEVQMTLCLTLAGAMIGFLLYNWKPAKIYLGDSGSNGLGMFLAANLVALGNQDPVFLNIPHHGGIDWPFRYQIFIITLLLAHPALEITLSVLRRTFRGKPAWKADNGHIHHRLLKLGFSTQAICFVVILVSLMPGLAALSAIGHYNGRAIWFMAASGMVFGAALPLLGFLDFLQPKALEHTRPHYLIANHFLEMQKLKLALAEDRMDILTLVNQTCQEFGVQSYRLFVIRDKHGRGGLDCTHEFPHSTHEYLPFLATNTSTKTMSFTDRIETPDHRGEAKWTFLPHTKEEDLDVEYRVLMNEFMRTVVEFLVKLGKNQPTLESPLFVSEANRSLSGHLLRKRGKQTPDLRIVKKSSGTLKVNSET